MDTSEISYRVADFLKQHPPFQAVTEADLVALATGGRVRFYEANEFILWQGEPHKLYVFVIQQGTVSLWDESDGRSHLRDVRGTGDMLGVERFNGAPSCVYSARSESDVVIYAFDAAQFEELLQRYPQARRFIDAYDAVADAYQGAADVRDPQTMFLHDVAGASSQHRCLASTSIAAVAQTLLSSGAEAIAVVDGDHRLESVVTAQAVIEWVAAGGGTADQPVSVLTASMPPAIGSAASVIDGVMALADSGAAVVALTDDGSSRGRLQALVTAGDIGRAFGDRPLAVLQAIPVAPDLAQLRALNHRARALMLQHLMSAASIGWLARFAGLVDAAILARVIALAGVETAAAAWCWGGASGRGESLTRHAPLLLVITGGEPARLGLTDAHARVSDALAECGYLTRTEVSFDRSFLVAGVAEWRARYADWLRDAVRSEMYRARPLFDLRPVHGQTGLWHDIEATVGQAIDRDILHVLANDCLGNLPPLTFFQDAVIEESGEHASVFRLEGSALQPLVDVGRVFGMAAGRVLGTSTAGRLAAAHTMLPEHAWIFRDAAETLRILLWQQARIGIARDTTGSELPPALLSRHDRHVLKSGFRAILQLVEFTGNSPWLAAS